MLLASSTRPDFHICDSSVLLVMAIVLAIVAGDGGAFLILFNVQKALGAEMGIKTSTIVLTLIS